MRNLLVIFLFWITFGNQAKAADDFIEAQVAGLLGAVHVSYGVRLDDKHHFSLGIGYVPELNFHDDMVITSFKYRYQPEIKLNVRLFDKSFDWYPVSLSVAAIKGKDNDIYNKLPNYIPNGYYFPTARRVVFAAQSNLVINRKVEAYWDWSIIDVGLINYIRNFNFYRDNYNYAGLAGVVSLGGGLRWRF